MSTNKKAKTLGILGVGLCALCCALPVIGAAIGIASLASIVFYLEKIGIAVLALAGFFLWYAWYIKRKKAKAGYASTCGTNCDCKTTVTSE